ncbi:MAG: DUF4412 domain-containing protein [Bacteroidia bacterium]|nr:DUF4412 domain-containing protein [Bacteroidia bacterium]
MKSALITLALVTACWLPQQLDAQSIPNVIERKVARKTSQAADQVLDRAADTLINRMFKKSTTPTGSGSGTTQKPTTTSNGNEEVTITTSDSEVTIGVDNSPNTGVKPSEFIGSFTMEIHSFDSKGNPDKNNPVRMQYHIAEYQFAVLQVPAGSTVADEKNITIFDRQTRKMTSKAIDNKGNKTASVTKIPSFMIGTKTTGTTSSGAPASDVTVKKTGKTKMIEGFSCEEILIETTDATTTVWFTTGWKYNPMMFMDFIKFRDNTTGQVFDATTAQGYGAWLEMHTVSKKDNTKSDMYVRSIKNGLSTSVFSLDGYQVSDMSSIFGN